MLRWRLAVVARSGEPLFYGLARRFSTGGWLSLFFKAGKTIEVTNFFSP